MSFNQYVQDKQDSLIKKKLEQESNGLYWAQLQAEVNYQDSQIFLANHFGRVANSIKMTDTNELENALVNAVAFRLTYALAEAQQRHQLNQRQAEAQKALGMLDRHSIGDIYKLSAKGIISCLYSHFDKHYQDKAESASRTLAALKTANENTLIGMVKILLGDKE